MNKETSFYPWFNSVIKESELIDNRYPMSGFNIQLPNCVFMVQRLQQYMNQVWINNNNNNKQQQQQKTTTSVNHFTVIPVSLPMIIPPSLFYHKSHHHQQQQNNNLMELSNNDDDETENENDDDEDNNDWSLHHESTTMSILLTKYNNVSVSVHDNEPQQQQLPLLTSSNDTTMFHMISLWTQSHRELPRIYMQNTCTLFRNEIRSFATHHNTPLIRSKQTEFIYFCSVHAQQQESEQHLTRVVWPRYLDDLLCQELGIQWQKCGMRLERPVWDRYPNAVRSQCYDFLLPNGRVLSIVSVHELGQFYAREYKIQFNAQMNNNATPLEQEMEMGESCKKKKNSDGGGSGTGGSGGGGGGGKQYPFMNVHYISTRVLAASIAVHGDDKGLQVMPQYCRIQVVIIPILPPPQRNNRKRDSSQQQYDSESILQACYSLVDQIAISDCSMMNRVTVDDNEKTTPGAKFNYWEKRGVPLRVEVGPRDLKDQMITIARRDNGEKERVPIHESSNRIHQLLQIIQHNLCQHNETYQYSQDNNDDDSKSNKMEESSQKSNSIVYTAYSIDDAIEALNVKNCMRFVRVPMYYEFASTEPLATQRKQRQELQQEYMTYEKMIFEATNGAEMRGFVPRDEFTREEQLKEEREKLVGQNCIFTLSKPANVFMYFARS